MPRRPDDRPPGPPPDEAALREAALAHLARYATSRARLLAVLDRRIARWLRAAGDDAAIGDQALADQALADQALAEQALAEQALAEQALAEQALAARAAARRVADRLVELGVIDDVAFAAARARSLARAGRSRIAVAAHLAVRGIAAETAQAVLPDDPEAELAAALAHARRRRLGPFRTAAADPARMHKELAAMARAGFSRDVALRVLRMDPAIAEAMLREARET